MELWRRGVGKSRRDRVPNEPTRRVMEIKHQALQVILELSRQYGVQVCSENVITKNIKEIGTHKEEENEKDHAQAGEKGLIKKSEKEDWGKQRGMKISNRKTKDVTIRYIYVRNRYIPKSTYTSTWVLVTILNNGLLF